MKHSKIFLAVTTCFLAVAGVAATKAHNFSSVVGYYTGTNGHCTAQISNVCSIGTGSVCKTAQGVRTIYSLRRASAPCSGTPLQYTTE